MTEPTHDDRPIVCLDCDAEVTLSESEHGTLVLRCDCDDRRRHAKVSRVLPEVWA